MAKKSEDYLYIDNGTRRTRLRKVATRDYLEKKGARHLQTDAFHLGGIEKKIEYMIIEEEHIIVWRKNENDDNYKLHLHAPTFERYLPSSQPKNQP